ncbi:MAG: bifunctional salicylyl-CoA 5-hydroxylase/oxidoreductase [Myxococcales bacterium]|nr:bifunctional salicylyl-CoA 5-hydroxylase/oxidoreductase [Myxococcales bacterium]
MRIVCVGGGPGGLYAAALLKRADPKHEIIVYERNRPDDTFGFGVVFSDATLGNIRDADPETFAAITANFAHWDDIDVHYRGQVLRSTGHGFAGLSRQRLLHLLRARCEELGVALHFETEITTAKGIDADLIIAADGLNSRLRDARAAHFQPRIEYGRTRFTWLGTTRQFPAFTFYFREDAHGLWRVHAYNFEDGLSTFIVETTDDAWRKAGLEHATERETASFCAELFQEELQGHPLLCNYSIWRQFPTVTNARWHDDNIVLLGDAAHTAHFSVGSGTKLAMEDAIALRDALAGGGPLDAALNRYQAAREPDVESVQRAAAVSQAWFEDTDRYFGTLEPQQFAYSLLTRSLRISHANLAVRDPAFTAATERWFADHAGVTAPTAPPPMFTPFRTRGVELGNRIVVSPMCMYSADDGVVNDWHLVHLGSRAVGGAGLIMTEMTDVTRDGRISPGCAGLYDDAHVAPWRRITDFVHAHSAAAIGVQLAHAGRKGSTRRLWEGIDRPLPAGNWPLMAPSPLPYATESQTPREMTLADLKAVRAAFVAAARRAEAAGFDLIELHFAHGYLLHTFLSPLSNARADAYGGSFANRARFPLEIFADVRDVWPADKPIFVRVSATDWIEGGLDGDDTLALAELLKAAGCDLLDVSTGGLSPEARPRYGRLYQTPFAERVRLEVGLPTMTVGNVSSHADANSVLAAGRADLVALARAHLFDPYWTRHAAYDLGVDGPAWPPQYAPMRGYRPRFDWLPDPDT